MTGYVGGPDLLMKHDCQPVLRYILIFYSYKKKREYKTDSEENVVVDMMFHWVKILVSQIHDLSFTPGTYMVE